MTDEEFASLTIAVGMLAHLTGALTATLAHLAEHIPDEEIRAGALKDLDEQAEGAKRLAAMFPPESLEPNNMIIH